MYKIIVGFSLLLISCAKDFKHPVSVSSASSITQVNESILFHPSVGINISLSPGVNTIQSDSFTITGVAYPVRFEFGITNNFGQFKSTSYRFYLDGAEVPVTISVEDNTLIVALKRAIPLFGTHSYILQARVVAGFPGQMFSTELTNAFFVDSNRVYIPKSGLPQQGDTFTLLK